MKNFSMHTTVKNGDIDWGEHGFKRFTEALKEFEGKNIEIIMKEVSRNKYRTLRQNAYLFGVVYPYFAEKMGEDKDAVHEILKHKFLGVNEEKALADEKFKISRSTASLDVEEMRWYIEQCRRLYFEVFHETIPEPED